VEKRISNNFMRNRKLAGRYKNGGKMNRTKNNAKHDKIIQYFPQETWQTWLFGFMPGVRHQSMVVPVALAPHLNISILDKSCKCIIHGYKSMYVHQYYSPFHPFIFVQIL
jgi:hypothetical protein